MVFINPGSSQEKPDLQVREVRMPHRTKLAQDRNSAPRAPHDDRRFEGWIPTLLVCIAVIGMFASVVAVLLGSSD